MAKDVDGFLHEANARNDVRLLAIRGRFGLEGVGWYWCVLEMLRVAADYKLLFEHCEGFAVSINVTTERFNELLDAALKLHLFESDDGRSFFSPSLLRRMKKYESKCAALRANAKQMLSKCRANAEQMLSNGEDLPSPSVLPLPLFVSSSLLQEEIQGSGDTVVQPPGAKKKNRAYQSLDARGNERTPHPKFSKLWLSRLEISSLEKRFEKAGLRPEWRESAYMVVEQWFTDTAKGRREYPQSSNHMRRVGGWGLKTALEMQRTSDSAKRATASLR